jgi:outer membrane receptor protein involved in Fe transport
MNASADVRLFGSQFDDDLNAFVLRAGSVTDARVAWTPAPRVEAFVIVENAFDAEIDTGRTPIRTIGTPRSARIGVRLRF